MHKQIEEVIYYRKCPVCLHVSKTDDLSVCPICNNGYSDSHWPIYPSESACGFFYQFIIGVHSVDDVVSGLFGFHEIQPTCLFLTALYEECLRQLMKDTLSVLNTPNIVGDYVLESCDGQLRQINALNKLWNKDYTFRNAIPEYIRKEFFIIMDKVVTGRNRYAHGQYDKLDNVSNHDLEFMATHFFEAFVAVHNQVIPSIKKTTHI